MFSVKKILILCVALLTVNSAFATVGVDGYSPPSYVEYDMSMFSKRTAVLNVIENAALYESSTIYIYYHDAKSKKLASTIQSKLNGKLPPHATVNIVDQESGVPKYPYKYTPKGVAIVTKDGKCIKCQTTESK